MSDSVRVKQVLKSKSVLDRSKDYKSKKETKLKSKYTIDEPNSSQLSKKVLIKSHNFEMETDGIGARDKSQVSAETLRK